MASARQLSPYFLLPMALNFVGCDKLALSEHTEVPIKTSSPGDDLPLDDAGGGFVPSQPAESDGGALSDAGADAEVPPPACGYGPATDRAFSKTALLQSFAECTQLQYCLFEEVAQTFAEKAGAYAAKPDATALKAVQDAWYYALQQWQVAELFRFGPAAPTMELGGKDLRDQIYAWPNAGRCAIETQIAGQGVEGDKFASAPVTARGFWAAEYLLFYPKSDNACSETSSLNFPAPGSWGKISVAEMLKRKSRYVDSIARDIHARAIALIAEWDPTQGNFTSALANAGHGSAVYETEQTGLNAVSHSLYYADKELKDWKIARPAGLGECTTACAGTAESLYAKIGSKNAIANLKGFRLLFQGCGKDFEGLGFDDWLRTVGAGDVADRMIAALDNADKILAGIDLDQAFAKSPSKVVPARDALKAITDILKTDMMTVLNLERPMALEGDND